MTDVAGDAIAAAQSAIGHPPTNHHSTPAWFSPLPDLFARLDHLTHTLVARLIEHSELLITEKGIRVAAMEQSQERTSSGRDQDASIAAYSHAAETIRTANDIRGLEVEIAHLRFVIEHRAHALFPANLTDDLTPID